MGEDKLVALIQESLAVATRMGAAKPADFRQVVIDTTVQEKAIAFPTDAKLMHRARERLVRLAQARGVTLRQSYVRVGKIALIRHQRYAHAKQFKRATRALRSLRTMLGRVIRDITRKIVGRPELADVFALPLLACWPGQGSAPAPAWPEALLAACSRGRVHWQRKGPQTL